MNCYIDFVLKGLIALNLKIFDKSILDNVTGSFSHVDRVFAPGAELNYNCRTSCFLSPRLSSSPPPSPSWPKGPPPPNIPFPVVNNDDALLDMGEYSRMDPYLRSRYEEGIDSKIVIMGNSGLPSSLSPKSSTHSATGVGKTSLLQRYTQNKFDPKNTTSTSGAFFVTKKVYVNGLKVRLQLWDTAGQERFRSMAPMYYRGANAALLLYDITNASTFNDIRGWLEGALAMSFFPIEIFLTIPPELKKNCPPELIIYIVGSKADLYRNRAVTTDLARLSLHNWFPPPKPPAPPPPPPPPSTLSYIRPRFTSFPGLRSPPATPTPIPQETPAYLDLPANRSSGLQRNKTVAQSRPRNGGGSNGSGSGGIARANSMATSRTPQSSRFSLYGPSSGSSWIDSGETSSNSINEDDEDAVDFESEDQEWGLSKGMELFEVSAKDDLGIENLFEHLISAIIVKKDIIEQENELKKRDSVFLSNISSPVWAAQAEEEEARVKAAKGSGSWACC
ncbi:hypothetical protein DXG01_015823 [Tephrocybe rancida]|nr:hypothetical protein DXG01_015823 [Tephrocybe rancida]